MREGNRLDIFEFARGDKTLTGTFSLEAMPELASSLTGEQKAAAITYSVRPCKGVRSLPAVELTLQAYITTACVYCGEACRIRIEKTLPFLLTRTEAQADALPIEEDGDYDVVVGSENFELCRWIQEEVILSLPPFPRHEGCRNAAVGAEAGKPSETTLENKPFAGLSALLKH